MNELQKKLMLAIEIEYNESIFKIREQTYKEAITKRKNAKWYNRWYYQNKEKLAYERLITVAGEIAIAKHILSSMIEKEIGEKEEVNTDIDPNFLVNPNS